ncbi:MAG TPA: tripartite tricarboxylate transporter permease, partial [Candidatus Microbacterium pullistercoris]|nr:tripartite tricarboxylate transporter permease [Candidatus Microbacterium pullistercoris]
GAIEGVAGPEAANNAAAAGVLVPLLTLGLPTTATAAIIISAFQTYGIRPGPLLFDSQPALVWALVASLYIGNLVLVILNLPLVGMWAKVLQIPRPYLYAGILVFAGLGAYAANFTVFDIGILLVLGVIGFLMRRHGYPVAPMVVGAILGPMAEEQLRKAMAISQGDPMILIQGVPSMVIYGAMAVLLVLALWLKRRQRIYEERLPDIDTTAIRQIEDDIERETRR